METSTDYLKNINYLKGLNQTADRKNMQSAYVNEFEAIYQNAIQSNVKLDSAQQFIKNLNERDLYVLQKYTGLAEAINANALTQEGAYNLLMHDCEKYDFDGDGIVKDGAANMAPIIPAGMSDDIKQAYVNALNSVSDKDRLMSMTLTFDMGRLNAAINNTPYEPTTIDYSYIKQRVNDILYPRPPAYSSWEVKNSISTFWEKFQQEL